MQGAKEISYDPAHYMGSIKKYLIVREIGSAKEHLYPVFRAFYYDSDRKETVNCVIKAISSLTSFQNELGVYKLKPHSSILKCLDVIEDYTIDFGRCKGQSYNLLVFPYLRNGDFIKLISNAPLDEPTVRYYLELILDAVEYLHENGLAHRDIKPDNILLDDNFNPILIDFGHTVKHSDEKGLKIFKERSDITTPGICPPEFHKKVGYFGTRMDMFALGRLIFNLITGLAPFNSSGKDDPFFAMIEKRQYDAYWKKVESGATSTWKIFGGVSKELKELIQGLLHPLSGERLTIEEVRASAWFQKTEPKSLGEIKSQILKIQLSK